MKTTIKFMGFVDDKEWPHFAWRVEINGECFTYKTGIGHETPCDRVDRKGFYLGMNRKPQDKVLITCSERKSWAHVPNIDDVLNCLISDSEAGKMSFQDFCADFGHSDDSLKALDVYRECMESGAKLRKALGAEYSEQVNRINKLREEGSL